LAILVDPSDPFIPLHPSQHLMLGSIKATAKRLMKQGSKLGPLYNMLYGLARIILEETEEDSKPLLEELAAELVYALLIPDIFLSLVF